VSPFGLGMRKNVEEMSVVRLFHVMKLDSSTSISTLMVVVSPVPLLV
jgi:hypothetical protein